MIVSGPILRAWREVAAWAAGRRHRYRVVGPSMEPTLTADEFVLVAAGRSARPTDLVVARVPRGGTDPGTGPSPADDEGGQPGEAATIVAVKRVERVDPDQGVWLASDNPAAGTDSRRWGPVEPDQVLGRVTLNLSRPLASLDRPSPSAPGRPGNRSWARWLRR